MFYRVSNGGTVEPITLEIWGSSANSAVQIPYKLYGQYTYIRASGSSVIYGSGLSVYGTLPTSSTLLSSLRGYGGSLSFATDAGWSNRSFVYLS